MAADSERPDARRTDLPPAVLEDLVGDPRRQTALRCLADNGGSMAVDDLVGAVLAREPGNSQGRTDERRRRVRWELQERHLPKLTATGVLSYDSMRDRVRLERPEILERAPE